MSETNESECTDSVKAEDSLIPDDKAGPSSELVMKFNSKPDPKILLLALHAGGVVLSLVGANHLLLIDDHWNPQLENQAQDRIYRLGQKKDVHVYKYICNNSIEERVRFLQVEKLEIAAAVLAGSATANSSALSLKDLKTLFGL